MGLLTMQVKQDQQCNSGLGLVSLFYVNNWVFHFSLMGFKVGSLWTQLGGFKISN